MTQEAIDLLKNLQSSGNTGLAVLIGTLTLVVLAGGWLIWIQHFASRRFDFTIKSIEAQIKSADAARQDSRAAQELSHKTLLDQFSVVLQTNQNLRSEIERIEKKQEGLKDSVRNMISVGLEDIKNRIGEISVSELIEQIPQKFRQDLEGELTETADRVMRNLGERIKSLPDHKLTISDDLRDELSHKLERAIREMVSNLVDRHYHLHEREYIHYLAKAIAYELSNHPPHWYR